MKKKLLVSIVAFVMLFSSAELFTPQVQAMPYDSYNYSYWVYPVRSPAPYLPDRVMTGKELGVGEFNNPRDLFVTQDNQIYVADAGNNRIVIFNEDWSVDREIDSFRNAGQIDKFNNPIGVFVTEDGTLYVADRDNRRIAILNSDDRLVGIIENPESEILPNDYVFEPIKVSVDTAGRVFVVAQGVYEGIMEFSPEGQFEAYTGTNLVSPNMADYFWRIVSTQAQRAQMVQFIPTEFSNLDIDERNFIYATNIDANTNEPIKRINAFGNDILKRHGYHNVAGDLRYDRTGSDQGTSRLTDIVVAGAGKYSALDSRNGRIFTYDDEGNLLYIFGAIGTQKGTFRTPVAIDLLKDQYLVLDRGRATITTFSPTLFGKLVNDAVYYQYEGIMEEAADAWAEVLKLNANYELAYMGLGKSLLRQGKHKEALGMFELGMDKEYYGIAYKRYRRDVLKESYEIFFTVVTIAAVAYVGLFLYGRARRKRGGQSADR